MSDPDPEQPSVDRKDAIVTVSPLIAELSGGIPFAGQTFNPFPKGKHSRDDKTRAIQNTINRIKRGKAIATIALIREFTGISESSIKQNPAWIAYSDELDRQGRPRRGRQRKAKPGTDDWKLLTAEYLQTLTNRAARLAFADLPEKDQRRAVRRYAKSKKTAEIN